MLELFICLMLDIQFQVIFLTFKIYFFVDFNFILNTLL